MNTNTVHTVAAQNNKLYRGSGTLATFTEITGAVVDTSDNITMADAFQKVFVVNGIIKLVIDFLNNKIGYSTGLTTAPLKGDLLTQTTTGAKALVDYVSSDKKYVYATKITTENFDTTSGHTVSSDNAGGVTMNPASFLPSSIAKPTTPHYSDWSVHPSKTIQLPSRCYLVCRYNGRGVLAGNPEKPGAWYMTRQADWFDLDSTTLTDLQSPVSSDNADYGDVGDIIKCLAPWHDDYLIFGCEHSMHYIQGDPRAGGSRLEISNKIGMFGDKSWCFDGNGNFWFYGTGGIYRMSVAHGITPPQNITSDVIANLVTTIDADPHTHKVLLGYDKTRNGIKLTSTNLTTGANKGYWIQLSPLGIWPETVDSTISVYSMFEHNDTDSTKDALLLGSKDGFIRKESDSAKDDEGTSTDLIITSELLLPVIPAGIDADSKGKIVSTTIITSGGAAGSANADTDSVLVSFYKAESLEEISEAVKNGDTPLFTKTLTGGGRANRIREKFVARAVGIKLSNNTAGESWSINDVNVQRKESGGI